MDIHVLMDISLQLSMLLWISTCISMDLCGYPSTDLPWILDPGLMNITTHRLVERAPYKRRIGSTHYTCVLRLPIPMCAGALHTGLTVSSQVPFQWISWRQFSCIYHLNLNQRKLKGFLKKVPTFIVSLIKIWTAMPSVLETGFSTLFDRSAVAPLG